MDLSMGSNSPLIPLDKYLVLGDRAYQIYKTNKQQEVFIYSGRVTWYDSVLDGPAMSWEQLEASRPEVLV